MKSVYGIWIEEKDLHKPVKKCKKDILLYLKDAKHKSDSYTGEFEDIETNKVVQIDRGANYAYDDGTWWWTDGIIYHFEKYDLKLDPEFVAMFE